MFFELDKPNIHLEMTDVISHQLENSDESDINHMEEVIIGSEQGTTFPTKIGATM